MRLPLVVEAFDATMDGLLEVIGVGEGSIGEMVLLEVAPTMLDGVELGRVLGQPLQREPRPRSECLGRELAGMDRTIVHDNDQRLDAFFLAIDQAEIIEQADKVGRALGGAGADKKPGADWVEGAQHGAAPSLSRRLDAQVGAALGPTMGQVGMGACLGRVEEKEVDHPRGGLAPQFLQSAAAGSDGLRILAPLQGVPWPAPSEPLWRSCTESQALPMAGPPRRRISALRRGKVHR